MFLNKNNYNLIVSIIAVILAIILLKKCEPAKIEEKTITKIETVYDTITKTIIKDKPRVVYVEKKRDTIIYRDKKTDSTITANQFETTLESDGATADLKITTTGELLDVSGVIIYPKETKTTTITKTVNASGMFVGANISILGEASYGLNLDYQIKNKIIIGGFINYMPNQNNMVGGLKIGIKL